MIGTIFTLSFIVIFSMWFWRHKSKKTKAAFRQQYLTNGEIPLHIVSETEWVTKGQGVHTAFLESIQLLQSERSLKIIINNQGHGALFHAHTYGPYYFYKGWRYKGRRILTAHVIPDSSRGTLPHWRLLMPFTTAYLKMAYNFADVVIAISPMVAIKLKELGIKAKIITIYNPVIKENWSHTTELRKSARENLGISPDSKLVLGVGQLQARKGVEDFIAIAEAMPALSFVWVGGRPWGRFTEGIERIDERIMNCPPNLKFVGLLDVSEMAKMYAAGDLFLFPSYQENCPLAPLEAAASGLPVIFRDLPEYRLLYNTPYLKAVTNEAFITAIETLINDPLAYQHAAELSAHLLQCFDKGKIRSRLVALYHEIFAEFYLNTKN